MPGKFGSNQAPPPLQLRLSLQSGRRVHLLVGHCDSIQSSDFSPTSDSLVSFTPTTPCISGHLSGKGGFILLTTHRPLVPGTRLCTYGTCGHPPQLCPTTIWRATLATSVVCVTQHLVSW